MKELQEIENGLKANHSNHNLYFLLGEALLETNVNQAYLSYENALHYAIKTGNSEDIVSIGQKLKSLEKHVNVRSYSFVILSYNTLDLTRACISSIRTTCLDGTYELVVVDNCSTDGSVEWLEAQSDVHLIKNSENLGFPGGCNVGIKAANPKNDIMFLNSDTIVMANSMYTLRMGLYSETEIGLSGSCSNNGGRYQSLSFTFDEFDDYINYSKHNNIPLRGQLEYMTFLSGFAMLAKRSALEEVGYFDEDFFPGNFEDNDLSIRFAYKGYKSVCCWNSFIYHFGGMSFISAGIDDKYNNLIYANLEKFKAKWSMNPDPYSIVNMEIIRQIQRPSDANFNVLEIGCDGANTLAKIKYLFPNANVYGVDSSDTSVRLASLKVPCLCLDITKEAIPYDNMNFDYIILAQTYVNGEAADSIISKVRSRLAPEGVLLIS